MRSILRVLPFIALTFLCWGNYGPLMHRGQHGMHGSWRPFICVGLAYFLIAVLVPILLLRTRGEPGKWTAGGTLWSLLAGSVGALGALGIILAFKYKGSPIYVMPLVFGCAPVVNTFVTMWMAKTYKEAGAIFYAGVVTVALGGAGVLLFKPTPPKHEEKPVAEKTAAKAEDEAEPKTEAKKEAAKKEAKPGPSESDKVFIFLSIALTAFCWGSYGPTLHKGQMKMSGSRLRPLLCVGVAYFAIAVIAPLFLLQTMPEPGSHWNPFGVFWSLGAGAAGAIGALGIILAFNFGGKPIYVMPLVFGCAPVVNTFTTIMSEGTYGNVGLPFFGSLALVVAGAVTVLIFAPKGHKPAGPEKGHGEKEKPVG